MLKLKRINNDYLIRGLNFLKIYYAQILAALEVTVRESHTRTSSHFDTTQDLTNVMLQQSDPVISAARSLPQQNVKLPKDVLPLLITNC